MIAYADSNDLSDTTTTAGNRNYSGAGYLGELLYLVNSCHDYNRYGRTKKDLEKFTKELKALSIIYNAQWILRNAHKLKFDMPRLSVLPIVVLCRKVIRCNRKGMGLRLRRDN